MPIERNRQVEIAWDHEPEERRKTNFQPQECRLLLRQGGEEHAKTGVGENFKAPENLSCYR